MAHFTVTGSHDEARSFIELLAKGGKCECTHRAGDTQGEVMANLFMGKSVDNQSFKLTYTIATKKIQVQGPEAIIDAGAVTLMQMERIFITSRDLSPSDGVVLEALWDELPVECAPACEILMSDVWAREVAALDQAHRNIQSEASSVGVPGFSEGRVIDARDSDSCDEDPPEASLDGECTVCGKTLAGHPDIESCVYNHLIHRACIADTYGDTQYICKACKIGPICKGPPPPLAPSR